MLEVLINFICAFILVLAGFYIIKKITGSNQKISLRVIGYLLLNSSLIAIVHYLNYSFISLMLNFIINTLTYKGVFKVSLEEAVVQTGILIMYLLIFDTIFVIIQINAIPLKVVQNNILVYLISNILVVLMTYLSIQISFIYKRLRKFYQVLVNKDLRLNMIFIILIIITACGILYSFIINNKFNLRFYTDLTVIASLLIIGIIFIKNKDVYNKLSSEYDILLSSVQNFEDWIEKEQYLRHEYKNQLAILYGISSEKEVKNKIQEIIDQNLDINNDVVKQLSMLPRGDLKGILHYKTIVAQKHKIKLTVDVSIQDNGIINKLDKKEINTLAKLIGIFYDNAIEAAAESKKRIVLLEIYELKGRVNFVISNTFKRNSIINSQHERGISSKGKGRGNGLYFANKILNKNKWIIEKNEIIDNYYVETITVIKNTSKK
ncbi:MAG: GHKL domain-containing protein [Bacilli bacterium]|nr:GHKL domain-containing protein [Bacilli bacterium]MBQ6404683.1 GHKL domain-containing protein [Bacilli bacterium]